MADAPKAPFVALIMAGGSGTRFWPMSLPQKPKQYLTLFGTRSLIQLTTDRLKNKTDRGNIFICSGESQKQLLRDQLPEISGLILEPSGRNTAPCLMLSVATLLEKGYSPSTVMGVFPADHFIGNEESFSQILDSAVLEALNSHRLVTLGIKPTYPHTGYGYIQAGEPLGPKSFQVKKFVEKPSLETAQEYLDSGSFFWNAGIFFWRLDAIAQAFQSFLPKEWELITTAVKKGSIEQVYSQLVSQPIDVAIMEKATQVSVIPAEMNWSDVGSWNALLELQQSLSGNKNVVIPKDKEKVTLIDSDNCLIASETARKVVLIGVEDLIVVDTPHGLLISSRTQDQKVKLIT